MFLVFLSNQTGVYAFPFFFLPKWWEFCFCFSLDRARGTSSIVGKESSSAESFMEGKSDFHHFIPSKFWKIMNSLSSIWNLIDFLTCRVFLRCFSFVSRHFSSTPYFSRFHRHGNWYESFKMLSRTFIFLLALWWITLFGLWVWEPCLNFEWYDMLLGVQIGYVGRV